MAVIFTQLFYCNLNYTVSETSIDLHRCIPNSSRVTHDVNTSSAVSSAIPKYMCTLWSVYYHMYGIHFEALFGGYPQLNSYCYPPIKIEHCFKYIHTACCSYLLVQKHDFLSKMSGAEKSAAAFL